MNVLLFGGTTEGRTLSRELADHGLPVTVCVATEYGAEKQGTYPGITVRTGRKDPDAIRALLTEDTLLVDATHPYATEVTRNLKEVAGACGVPYFRLCREQSEIPASAHVFSSACEVADALQETEGKILLTTGAKELPDFLDLPLSRLYVRVLPDAENIRNLSEMGFSHRQILAMEGPFSEELNVALLHQFHIRHLVTKDGGPAGGFPEKAAAAEKTNTGLYVIRGPEDPGLSYEAVRDECLRRKEESPCT
ncbi:MAG: precorrin-6A reductase [Clostridia bacterium]|nr:precorrin-6A reductase [Clostridia bacterium]